MNEKHRGLIWVHLATLLFGFSGLFAEWLHPLLPVQIVGGRTLFAAIFLILLLKIRSRLYLPKSTGTWGLLLASGMVLSFHWMAFFQAIQLTNVAIGLLTFSTFPLFTALLEPLAFRESLRPLDLGLSLLILIGMALISKDALDQNFGWEGIAWGLVGAASFAFMALINRRLLGDMGGLQIAAYQNFFAFLPLIPFNLDLGLPNDSRIWVLLILLGTLFTGVAHGLFNQSMAYIRATTASLVVGIEPIYSIILAAILLQQYPGFLTLTGGGLILSAGIIPSFWDRK